jgi:hypothetical protein
MSPGRWAAIPFTVLTGISFLAAPIFLIAGLAHRPTPYLLTGMLILAASSLGFSIFTLVLVRRSRDSARS